MGTYNSSYIPAEILNALQISRIISDPAACSPSASTEPGPTGRSDVGSGSGQGLRSRDKVFLSGGDPSKDFAIEPTSIERG